MQENGQEELTLEQAFSSLDAIVEKLESREISLEDSFTEYKKGMDLLKMCNDKIDRVEKKMLQINEDGEYSEV